MALCERRRFNVVVISALVLVGLLQLSGALFGAISQESLSPASTATYGVPGLGPVQGQLVLGAPLSSSTIVTGTLVFPGQDPTLQAQIAQSVNDPTSPLYHHFMTGEEFDQMFAPSLSLQDSLRSYLVAHGANVSVVNPFFWNIAGTASSLGAAFGTSFHHARLSGKEGFFPSHPLELPVEYRALGVEIQSGFQSFVAPHPANLLRWHPPTGARGSLNRPGATLSLNMSMTNGGFFLYTGTADYVNPPTNMNGTYELNITGGAAPYTITWNWGDGSREVLTASSAHVFANHMYYIPAQADYCNSVACWNLTVSVTDKAGDSGTMTVGVFTGFSPMTGQLYYDLKPLFKLGDSGAGTKIGLGEECDPSFANSQYMADANKFSRMFGLPLFTTTTLVLMGSGASTCSGGQAGWSGETMLDIEWAHVFAPNATLEVDLANSDPGEGDATWLTTSNGVFIASNSWGGATSGYDTTWNQAASQGQSYLTASGDCGSAGLSTSYPADIPTGVGVGGTQVYPMASGVFGTEYAWNGTTDPNGCANDEGSTGGYTTAYPAPAYQQGMQGFGLQDPSGCTSVTCRGVPDISAIGGTWVELVDNGSWVLSAGTSLACPSTAAMLDVMYQYNGTANKANGMANYGLYAIAKGSSYHTGFFDIQVGNNLVSGAGYTTQPGWDPVTGLGSFNVSQLAQLLAKENGNTKPYAPLTVVMSTNVTYGPASLSVSFGADTAGGTSSLSGYSYIWNFGDGTTSPSTTYFTSHVYASPGVYHASVNVTSGATSATSNSVTIVVAKSISGGSGILITSFTATPNPGTVGSSVTFAVSASGGTTPFTYAYSVLPPGCTTQNASSLTCTPTSLGTWNVTATVTDAAHNSASKVLQFKVNPSASGNPTVTSFAASPNPDTQGATTTISATVTGGTPPYSYAYSGLPTGCTSSNASLLSCTPQTSGTFPVSLVVTDSVGKHAYANISLVVSAPGSSPLSLAAYTVTPSTISVGTTATFTVGASGGYTPYAYSYLGLPGGCTSADLSSLSCTPTTAGVFQVTATVTDAKGAQVQGNATLTVQPQSTGGPTITAFTISPARITLGGSTVFTTTVSGGVPPYTYSFTGLPSGCQSTSPTFTCTPTATGSFAIYVDVTDTNGASYTASGALTVIPAGIPLAIPILTISSASVIAGSQITLTTSESGGVSPYSYIYSGLPNGCTSENLYRFSCNPTQVGQFTISVEVTDAAGHRANSTGVPLSVQSINSQSSGNSSQTILGLSPFDWVVILVIVAVVVAIVAVVLRQKGRKGTVPPPSPQPWAPPPSIPQQQNWAGSPTGYPPQPPNPGYGPAPPPPPGW